MFADRAQADTRVLDDSSYILPTEYVDRFANEVRGRMAKNRSVKKKRRGDESSDDDSDDDDGDNGGDPTDGLREQVDRATTKATAAAIPSVVQPPPSAPSDTPGAGVGSLPAGASTTADVPRTGDAQATDAAQSDQGPGNNELRTAIMKKLLKDCVKNWKAASDDDKKRMWAVFDESGIFACACRHGLMLWIVDMIRSGEL